MSDTRDVAGGIFRHAQSPADKRLAAHLWLGEAIREAMEKGQDVSPALALLSALEGLDFGKVDPMLKLPAGHGKGRKPEPPGETSVTSRALAAVSVMSGRAGRGSVKSIVACVEDALHIKPGALTKLRENFGSECGKPKAKRARYIGLEDDVAKDVAMYATMTDDGIMSDLSRVAKLLGLEKHS